MEKSRRQFTPQQKVAILRNTHRTGSGFRSVRQAQAAPHAVLPDDTVNDIVFFKKKLCYPSCPVIPVMRTIGRWKLPS